MRFVNRQSSQILKLGICLTFFFGFHSLNDQLTGQDEFIDDQAPSQNVDGMFDDGFEPIEEPENVRPENPRTLRNNNDTNEEENLEREESPRDLDPVRRPTRFTRPIGGRNLNTRRPLTEPERVLNFADSIPNPNEKLRMDFIQVDIEEVVKYFSERLHKKFIYDPAILSGKITIVSPTEVTVYEAYQAFLSAMEIRGYAVYPTGAYLKIEKVNEARRSPVPLYTETLPVDDSYVTRIINLKYLNVSDIRRAVQDLVSRTGGDVVEHAPTNTLIISDYASNIRRIIRILNILDVEGFQEQIAVVPLKYASANDIARKISEIFPPNTGSSNSRTTIRRSRISNTSAASNPNDGVIQKVVSDDRTNSLIVLGSERGIEQVQKFIEKIDIPVIGGDGQIHVYPLQNVKAEDLAQTLASLTSNAKSSTQANTNVRSSALTNTLRNTNPTAPGAESAELFNGDVKITADPRTNSLVIQASSRDYEVLKGIIRQLDIRRRQVFIESVILESTVGGKSEFGTSARGPLFRTDALGRSAGQTDGTDKSTGAFGFGGIDASTLSGTLQGLLGSTAITGLALGFQSGGTIEVPVPGSNGNDATTQKIPLLTAIVRLAATDNRLNVISTPHILATANEEASISIGEEIPQIASSQSTDAGNVVSNYNRIRVATELTITPQINAGDYLTLNIKQKVNARGAEVIPNSGQISTSTREATTTAIVKDGQTIVIGGIMRDEKTESVSKVPFLGDIPILGWLFKARTSDTQKVNLLLFITPHIIRDTGDMNDIFFRKLKDRETFLKKIGMKEKENLSISGYTPEDLNFLDEEYLKSLKLESLPKRVPETSQSDNPSETTPSLPVPPSESPTSATTLDGTSPSDSNVPSPNDEGIAPQLDMPDFTPPAEHKPIELIPILPPKGRSPSTEIEDEPSQDNTSPSNYNFGDDNAPIELSPIEDSKQPNDSKQNDAKPDNFELPKLPELEVPEN